MINLDNIRIELCETMRNLYDKDLISSIGGNASYFIKDENIILITPGGFGKNNLKPENIVKIKLNGEVFEEGIPSSEIDVHLQIFKNRGDIKAIVHAHPPYTLGVISNGIIPDSMTPEQIILTNDLRIIDFQSNQDSFNKELINCIGETNTIIVKNHGVFCLGNSLKECFIKIEVLEIASKIATIQNIFGNINKLNSDQIKIINEKYSKKK